MPEPIPRPGASLKSSRFRREREHTWRELEGLLEKAERVGLEGLSQGELTRLPTLYRGTVSSLSVALAISLDRRLLEYLSALASRAYVLVYGSKRPAAGVVGEFFRHRFPEAVRRFASHIVLALLLLAAGAATGFLLTRADPERFYSFVSEGMAEGRTPAAATDTLRRTLYDPEGWGGALAVFATFLFTHNAKVGILCFALGFAAGTPAAFLLFYNGLTLGAMAALFHSRGLGPDFWLWVLPHGVTELAAVCLCAAGGLLIGQALLFPGPWTRLESLRRRGPEAALLVVGAAAMFFVAALLEGFFRQLVTDPVLRGAVALASLAFWLVYFWTAGRDPGQDGGAGHRGTPPHRPATPPVILRGPHAP